MIAKSEMVRELGQEVLVLPELIQKALQANDQIKFWFSLLQAALSHAMHPAEVIPSLRRERQDCGLSDSGFDDLASQSQLLDSAHLLLPQAQAIETAILAGLETILLPLRLAYGDPRSVANGQVAGGLPVPEANDDNSVALRQWEVRLRELAATPLTTATECISIPQLLSCTRGSRAEGDSLHILLMDLHKALNRLQEAIAPERIEGAACFAIEEADRPLIRSFMQGVAATIGLKFDHPGLATTVMRQGPRLILQNDIGTTDAHVLIVSIEGLRLSVSYTDVHARRAKFFRDSLRATDLQWQVRGAATDALPESSQYILSQGEFNAGNQQQLQECLHLLGSRLVFLIDWNRARKRLRLFMAKDDAISVLQWAADNGVGHRGFLQLGGEQLVHSLIERLPQVPVSYGERLDQVLGRIRVMEYFRFVLATCAQGLLAKRSERLIQDELRMELLNLFEQLRQSKLDVVSRHAESLFDLAHLVRDGVYRLQSAQESEVLAEIAVRAAVLEQKADQYLLRSHEMRQRGQQDALAHELLVNADDVADALEDSAFLLTLLPKVQGSERLSQPLRDFADTLVQATQEYIKLLECWRLVRHGATREDMQDFLEAADNVLAQEHLADALERRLVAMLVEEASDAPMLHVYTRLIDALENSADALARTSLMIRDQALAEPAR